MSQAIAYMRVSTAEQAVAGVSLDAQRDEIRRYAAWREIDLAHEIVDAGVTGSKPLQERDGGRKLFDLAKEDHIRIVIAYKLDRLFRDAADCLIVTKLWDELEVDLHLIDMGGQAMDTSTAFGRFFLTIMAGVAEMERNLIGERTKVALAHLKANGKRTGGLPYGKGVAEDGKTLVVDLEEQEVIRMARQLRKEGKSLRQIAGELAQEGHRSRKGAVFHPQQIHRMLKGD